jgi:hypothetical protein
MHRCALQMKSATHTPRMAGAALCGRRDTLGSSEERERERERERESGQRERERTCGITRKAPAFKPPPVRPADVSAVWVLHCSLLSLLRPLWAIKPWTQRCAALVHPHPLCPGFAVLWPHCVSGGMAACNAWLHHPRTVEARGAREGSTNLCVHRSGGDVHTLHTPSMMALPSARVSPSRPDPLQRVSPSIARLA